MTNPARDEVSRYARLGPEARTLFDDYDALDLATMLVAAKNDIAACRAQQWPRRLGEAELALARIHALNERWVKAGPPPLGTSISRWWDKRLAELGAALDARPANGTTRRVHVTITNPDEYTANRAALSLVDWINAEFPGHHVTTDAHEWEQPGPG